MIINEHIKLSKRWSAVAKQKKQELKTLKDNEIFRCVALKVESLQDNAGMLLLGYRHTTTQRDEVKNKRGSIPLRSKLPKLSVFEATRDIIEAIKRDHINDLKLSYNIYSRHGLCFMTATNHGFTMLLERFVESTTIDENKASFITASPEEADLTLIEKLTTDDTLKYNKLHKIEELTQGDLYVISGIGVITFRNLPRLYVRIKDVPSGEEVQLYLANDAMTSLLGKLKTITSHPVIYFTCGEAMSDKSGRQTFDIIFID